MKKFFKGKKKFLLVATLMMVLLTGCSVPRDQKTGKTYINSIITIKEETVQKKNVSFEPGSKEEKQYKDLKPEDTITIPKTTWKDALEESWFNGLIVYPISQLINFVAGFSDGGVGIIVATILIQLIIFLFSIKSQVASQRMQALQPEMQKIQAKYAGRTDDRAKMMQAQEMQALYSKYKINPFGTILVTFIQFPVILGMYQATMRAYSVVTGSFIGIDLTKSPIEGLGDSFWYIVIFGLMIIFQLLSFKIPQWLQERRNKKNHVKEKKYAQPDKKANGMTGSMNMMMYMSTAMIAVFAINWPLAMSFYWLVGSVVRVGQNFVVHKYFMKD